MSSHWGVYSMPRPGAAMQRLIVGNFGPRRFEDNENANYDAGNENAL